MKGCWFSGKRKLQGTSRASFTGKLFLLFSYPDKGTNLSIHYESQTDAIVIQHRLVLHFTVPYYTFPGARCLSKTTRQTPETPAGEVAKTVSCRQANTHDLCK
jgi:hypothetical protein